jgi:peptidyl-prolyl cis-trans isomerase C
MQKNLKKISILALAAILATPALAQDAPTADTIVATVNGTDIKLGHMIVARATLPEQYQQLPDEVLFEGILDQLIQQTALSQSLTTEPPKRVTLSLENERRSLLAGEAIEGVLASALTETAVQGVYDAQYANMDGGPEYNASHILVATEEEAAAIKVLVDGGANFADTAREKSTGPSGPSGGELGWFSPGMMVEPFETAVAGMEAGQVSDPIQTQFGWHIIKLNETRQKPAPALEEVRAEIEEQIQRDAVDARVKEVTDSSEVDRTAGQSVDPALLKDMTLLEN